MEGLETKGGWGIVGCRVWMRGALRMEWRVKGWRGRSVAIVLVTKGELMIKSSLRVAWKRTWSLALII